MIVGLDVKHLPSLKRLFIAVDKEWNEGWKYNPELTLVYESKGEVVGFLTGWECGQPYAWMDNLITAPDCNRPRVALQLIMTMTELLKRRGAETIRVVICRESLVPQAERLGFVDEGKHTVMKYHVE